MSNNAAVDSFRGKKKDGLSALVSSNLFKLKNH